MKTIAALVLGLFIAGSVSADETEGAEGAKGSKGAKGKNHEACLQKRFDKIDANHDGQISKDEFIAFREAHRHHRKKADK